VNSIDTISNPFKLSPLYSFYRCFFTFFFLLIVCCSNHKNDNKLHRQNIPYPRIISFAPSITETVFALHAENHLAGVTDFCRWPEKAGLLPKVGGYINPSYEQILRLKPDVALVLKEHGDVLSFLAQENVKTITVNNITIESIIASIKKIGAVCNRSDAADSLSKFLYQSLTPIKGNSDPVPGVLFCVGRGNPGGGAVNKIYCAGPRSFYSELIERAGGRNTCTDSLLAYPSIGLEGVIRMQPDIIIDVMAANRSLTPQTIIKDWDELPMLPAVKNNTVYALTGNYVSIPGPRINLIFNDIRSCLKKWASRRGKADF
jgi:iron complex transport system substrate-binding protein